MLADQAPPSGRLRVLMRSKEAAPAATGNSAHKKTNYLAELQFWHQKLHPVIRERHAAPKQRRDAGVPTSEVAASAARTEAAFGRKRAAAVTEVVSASPRKRARMAQEISWVRQDGDHEVKAAPKCIEAVAKRTQQQVRKSAATAAANRGDRVLRSCLQPALFDQKDAPARPAGILLALPKEEQACRKARSLGFKLVQDPVEFVSQVGRQARHSCKGNAVLAPAIGASDYAVCARLAAAVMGAWYTDVQGFISAGRTTGCQYVEQCKARRSNFRLAVSADLEASCPSVMLLMRAVAEVPGSTFALYSVRGLTKLYHKQLKEKNAKMNRWMHQLPIGAFFPWKVSASKLTRPSRCCIGQFQISSGSSARCSRWPFALVIFKGQIDKASERWCESGVAEL